MTLLSVEAEEIVDACIRSAVGWDGLISGGNKLSQVGVVDDLAIDALIDELVTNNQVGVPSKQHKIDDPESLDLKTGTTVAQTQVQVIANSEAVQVAAKAAKAGAKKAGRGLAAPTRGAAPAKSSVRAGATKKKATKSGKGAAKKSAKKARKGGAKRAGKAGAAGRGKKR
ncbi:MAG TPA: hypothetical protein VF240_13110 [Pyrinomonadaceae bacterium]